VAQPVVGESPRDFGARLRGFGPLGSTVALAIALLGPVLEPLAGLLVLAWARASRTPWRDLGYVRPRSWIRTVAIGVVLGVALKLALKAVVMPLLGAPAVNPAYHYLAGNAAGLPAMIATILLAGGFAEETVFRGFLFERFGRLLGRSAGARVAIVLVTSVWFALGHYPVQGLAGAEQSVITGLVFGTIYARTGRIWLPMVAHVAYDLAALAIIYAGWETRVAHLLFR
jgi:membrane protease YdiL (CAAX protease family)